MDVIFNCPKCEQELAVDSLGAGSAIECPSCGESIVIPEPPARPAQPNTGIDSSAPHGEVHPVNPISSSAAAKVQLHLKVPSHRTSESLITKPLAPLDVAAKESDKKVRVKTIRHIDCVEVGRDKFDEVVTNFLGRVGEDNIISITALNYSHLDIGTQKLLTDYGVLIVYKG
jgi:DNA-directed RNA polymerase subunit RPC12/RpoP